MKIHRPEKKTPPRIGELAPGETFQGSVTGHAYMVIHSEMFSSSRPGNIPVVNLETGEMSFFEDKIEVERVKIEGNIMDGTVL